MSLTTDLGSIVKGIFILTIVVMILLVVAIGKGCNYIKENGAKNVAERIWNGPTNPPTAN